MMALIEECGRGRGGEHTGIVIHSLIPPVSACRLFSHCVIVICCIIFFHPAPTKTAPVTVCVYFVCVCVCVCMFVSSHWEHKTSASFENANRFYLWLAPVREWVSVLREVFVCNCVSVACGNICVCT